MEALSLVNNPETEESGRSFLSPSSSAKAPANKSLPFYDLQPYVIQSFMENWILSNVEKIIDFLLEFFKMDNLDGLPTRPLSSLLSFIYTAWVSFERFSGNLT